MKNVADVQSGFKFAKQVDIKNFTGDFYNELLRGMTHKLNNLLAVIQGFSSLVLMQDDLDESAKESLQHMKEAALNASGLGEKILPAGGCARIEMTPVNLNELLPMLTGSVNEISEKHNVSLQFNLPEALPAVQADSSRIREILIELVRNAVEAAAGVGEVSIDVLPPAAAAPSGLPEGSVGLFVRNTGPVIPEKDVDHVFKPFFTTKDSNHFGIGLTTAATLASQMDMPIGFKSEGNMTIFCLGMRPA